MEAINPTDALVISKKWLEDKRKLYVDLLKTEKDIQHREILILKIDIIDEILSHSTPLTPLIEDAFAEGHARFTECSESELEEKVERYLNSLKIFF